MKTAKVFAIALVLMLQMAITPSFAGQKKSKSIAAGNDCAALLELSEAFWPVLYTLASRLAALESIILSANPCQEADDLSSMVAVETRALTTLLERIPTPATLRELRSARKNLAPLIEGMGRRITSLEARAQNLTTKTEMSLQASSHSRRVAQITDLVEFEPNTTYETQGFEGYPLYFQLDESVLDFISDPREFTPQIQANFLSAFKRGHVSPRGQSGLKRLGQHGFKASNVWALKALGVETHIYGCEENGVIYFIRAGRHSGTTDYSSIDRICHERSLNHSI